MDIAARDADLLRQGAWFGRLPKPLQDLVFERSVARTFRKGEHVTRQGEPARGMDAVLDGQVHLLRQVSDAHEVVVDLGEAGFWFGNYGALSGGAPSVGSLVAITPVRALFLPLAEFERIVDDEPRYFRLFAGIVIDRYAHLYRYVAEIHGLPQEEWLRQRLLDLASARRDADARQPGAPVSIADVAVRSCADDRGFPANHRRPARPPAGSRVDRDGLPQRPRVGLNAQDEA